MAHDAQHEPNRQTARRRAARAPFDAWLHASLTRDDADSLTEPLPAEWRALVEAGWRQERF